QRARAAPALHARLPVLHQAGQQRGEEHTAHDLGRGRGEGYGVHRSNPIRAAPSSTMTSPIRYATYTPRLPLCNRRACGASSSAPTSATSTTATATVGSDPVPGRFRPRCIPAVVGVVAAHGARVTNAPNSTPGTRPSRIHTTARKTTPATIEDGASTTVRS